MLSSILNGLMFSGSGKLKHPFADKLSYTKTQKGKTMVIYRGYRYIHERNVKSKKYWRCAYYTTKYKCNARLHSSDNDEVMHFTNHNHI